MGRCRRLASDAVGRSVADLGAEAQSCDWTVPELFSACIRCRSNQRPIIIDWRASMTWAFSWLLRGRPVIALTSTEAVIRCGSGATLKFYNQAGTGGDRLHDADRQADVADRRRRTGDDRDRQGGDGMSGHRSRDKGARTERAIAKALQTHGFMAMKISGLYKPGADISMPLFGTDRAVEVKCRAGGFRQLYEWLDERDILIVKSDYQEPLVVVRLSLAAEIAKRTL